MKLFAAILTSLLISTNAMAASTMYCVITEGGVTSRETEVSHEFTDNMHAITHFETAYTKGFISVSRGYGVVNFVTKEDQRVFSFFGDALGGRGLGGTFYLADGTSWVSIECN